MADVKSAVSRSRGCWLYPISERGGKSFLLDGGEEWPVSVDTYKMLVEDGRLSEDERWGLHTNFHQVRPKDEIFIYTGDQDLGIVGFATVTKVDLAERELVLKFDIKKCKALVLNPISAKVVRKWIANPRAAVCNLSPFRSDIYKRLPWKQSQHQQPHVPTIQPLTTSAGFGSAEMNRKVELAAINRVKKMYLGRGWDVRSVEREKLGFDLLCRKGAQIQKVEVKGIRGRNLGFLITAGELRKASEDDKFVLQVVTNALSKHPQLKTWNGKQMLRAFDFIPLQYQAKLKC